MNRERRTAWGIFLVLLACYGYFFPRWADWNQNSRMDLTLAIVEQGSLQIDAYYHNTGDYAEYGGHIYTDKAPGTSFLGVPVYGLFRLLARQPLAQALLHRLADSPALAATLRAGGTGLLADKLYYAAALYAATFVVVSVPSAALSAVLYLFLGRLLPASGPRWFLVMAYGLGTIAFPYSAVFYGHQTASAALFLAFVLLYRLGRAEIGPNWLWIVGGLLGLAVLIEFPALVPLLVLCLYALRVVPRRWQLVKLALGGFPFALLLGWYNLAAFGSPFTSSYRYLGRFPEISNTGVLGFTSPSLAALWGVTLSPYRGLFFLSPFLLLAVPGLYRLLRGRHWQREAWLWAGLIAAHLLLISAWYDWRGGFATGPRNLLPVLPFFMPLVAASFPVWSTKPALRYAAWTLVGVSCAAVWIASVSGQDFAPIVIANPLFEFYWPQFQAGQITRNLGMVLGLSSWSSLAPLFVLLGGALWLMRQRMRLAA